MFIQEINSHTQNQLIIYLQQNLIESYKFTLLIKNQYPSLNHHKTLTHFIRNKISLIVQNHQQLYSCTFETIYLVRLFVILDPMENIENLFVNRNMQLLNFIVQRSRKHFQNYLQAHLIYRLQFQNIVLGIAKPPPQNAQICKHKEKLQLALPILK